MRAKTMTVHPSVQAWREARRGLDFTDCSIGFVPTMGALHAGHRAILERAWAENDRVVLSIFVNPTQFNDPADLQKYPRTLEADLALASEFTTDVIVPTPQELYPDDYRYRVTEQELSREMEGAQRPGHFDGVLTVVLKLLNLVQAHRVYLGEKDWQQLQLIRGMTKALYLSTEVIACPTIRGADGLALSSRNARLSADGRMRAVDFPKILRAAPDAASAALKLRFAGFDVDYVEDRDGVRLGAVRIENVRLIDNVRL
jgi:pantoate--beta-alanine ligase